MPVEYKAVSDLARTLGTIPASLKTTLRPAIAETLGVLQRNWQARLAYSHWQPGAVKTRVTLSSRGAGEVYLDNSMAPAGHEAEASLQEFGNGGNAIRHPTYGHDPWVSQPDHPAMRPATDETEPVMTARIEQAVTEAVRLGGLA